MGWGGKRPGAGRPVGAVTKRSRALSNTVVESGKSPLDYMMRVMADEGAEQARRDRMAENAAPFVHPKLNAIAAVDASANSGGTVEFRIFAVPRGAQVDANGVIRYPDGTPATAEETAFHPYEPTPDLLPALPSPEPAPAELELEAEADDKVQRLDSWRRRSEDDPTGAA